MGAKICHHRFRSKRCHWSRTFTHPVLDLFTQLQSPPTHLSLSDCFACVGAKMGQQAQQLPNLPFFILFFYHVEVLQHSKEKNGERKALHGVEEEEMEWSSMLCTYIKHKKAPLDQTRGSPSPTYFTRKDLPGATGKQPSKG